MLTFITFKPFQLTLQKSQSKLFKKQSNLDTRRNSFSKCIIDSWNNLPGENEAAINDLKNSLDIINCDFMYLY